MKPKVFVGSSVKGLIIANAIQMNLTHDTDCTVWNQGVFGISDYPLESLFQAMSINNFGVFVFSPEDQDEKSSNDNLEKKVDSHTVRGNVIFEAGMFMGRFGKERCYIVAPSDIPQFKGLSDLLGLKFGAYDSSKVRMNPEAALGPACFEILRKINSLSST